MRELSRAHLEALLVAMALLDFDVAERVDRERLSPAASRLLDGIDERPELARACGPLCAAIPFVDADGREDAEACGFVIRLARRVEALTLLELTFFSLETVVALANQLPIISAVPARSAA